MYLTADQAEAVKDMHEAIDALPPRTRLRCQNPELRKKAGRTFEYYQHIDYDERTPPDETAADLMCRTKGIMCPVARECLKLGLALDAQTGVWGGRTLVDGHELHTRNTEETNG